MRGGAVIFFLFSLWICLTQASAQNINRIDTLRKQLNRVTGVEKFNLLNDLGFEFRLSNPDSTIYYCLQAYALGQQLNLPKDLSKPLSFIGLANAYKGDYKASFDYHLKSVEVARAQQDSTQLAYCYNNFGRLFFDQGDLTRAYDNLIKSMVIFEKLDDPVGLAYVYRSLTNIHKSQQDYAKALEMAQKAFKLRKQIGDPRGLLSALIELGSVYSEMKSSLDANRCFKQADSIAVKIGDDISLAEIRIGWAEFLVSHGEVKKADTLARQAYAMVNRTRNIRLLPRATLLMGVVHYHLEKLGDAKKYFESVIKITEQSHLDMQRDALFYLSKIHEKEGKQAEATLLSNKYLILKESLQSVELARQIEKLQFQLEIEKKERENELLKTNESRNSAIIRQKQLENIILIVIIAFVSLLLLLQWRNSRKRKDANVRLETQNQKIEKQRKEIIEQNEKLEKRNLELSELNHEQDTLMNIVAHDLKSPLNRIIGLADLLEMEGELNVNQKKYLSLIKDSTRSGLDLITDLLDVNALEVNREPEFSVFNLNSFLNERANVFRHYAASKNIDIKLTQDFNDPVYLDQEYLARIMDNLISNAIKFSRSNSTVRISTGIREGSCVISVQDDGPGFQSDDLKFLYQKFKKLSARPTGGESSNGLGLAIVKILVDRLGGKIELQTAPGKGSTFEILFPLKSNVLV